MSGHELLPLYALDCLPEDERVAFDAHLATCDACRRELADYGPALQRLTDETEVAPPPALRTRVMAQIARVPQDHPDELPAMPPAAEEPEPQGGVLSLQRAPVRAPATSRWLAFAAAVLAFALIAVSTAGVGLWRRNGQLEQQVAQRAEASELASVLAAPDARLVDVDTDLSGDLRVVVSDSMDSGVVVADDLQAPPEDRIYQLWMIDDGQPRSAGLVQRRNGVLGMLSEVAQAQAVAISVEPPSGSDAPTGPIVGQAPLQ